MPPSWNTHLIFDLQMLSSFFTLNRTSSSKTSAAPGPRFPALLSLRLLWPHPRILDVLLEKRRGPSRRKQWGILGPPELRKRIKRGKWRQKQENSTSLRFIPNIPSRSFNLANPKLRTRSDSGVDCEPIHHHFIGSVTVSSLVFVSALFQFELPLEEFEGKLNKSKLKLVLTNGKIQG